MKRGKEEILNHVKSILFVDDNTDILEANRSYFTEQGFEIAVCTNGRAAIELMEKRLFDCIVLDVMMPEMDGYAVCRALRKRTDAPVIFLSCLDHPDDKVQGLMLGGDAYMVKPYDLRELHAQVIACLRRGERNSNGAGDFAIDRERRIVRLCDHSAILSKKEMALLSLLLSRPDMVLTKETICEELWPRECVDENRLQSMVRNLRRKIGFAESRIGCITNIYGTGYRLDTRERGRL